jgi:DNA-binding response OmpR family regulator
MLPALLRWLAMARDGTVLAHGELEIDLTACAVRVDGQIVDFTAREFALLSFLARSPGHVYSREQLLESVWLASAGDQSAATVTEHIRRVRAKLAAYGAAPRVVTVRGLGYRFES